MADKKISLLSSATSIDGTEDVPIVQTATTKKITIQLILDWILGRENTFSSAQTINSNVVISDNSSNAALRVTQVGSGNAILVEDSANPDSTPFIVDANGKTSFGGTPPSDVWFGIQNTVPVSTTSSYVIRANATFPSTSTVLGVGHQVRLGTEAATFTVPALYYYSASQGTFGLNSSVTVQYGFSAGASLTGAGTNYGFHSAIASAAGRYNFYAAGTADNWFSGNVLIGGAGGLGYTTGSGGAVTQGTSRTTGVTLNKTNGAITLVSAAGSTTWQTFTVTNSTVAATDIVIVSQKSGTDLNEIHVTAVGAGSFNISFRTTGGTTTEQPVFNFAVIKAVTA